MKLHKARRLGMKWKSRRVSPNLQQFKKKTLIIIYLFLFAGKRAQRDSGWGETLNLGYYYSSARSGRRKAIATRSEPLNDEMNQLIDLQEIDVELAGFDQEISEQQQAIDDRQLSIDNKKAAIADCRERIKELLEKKRTIETENEDAGARIKDRQNKMMQVQTSREHQALLKEIEENKRLVKETEEQLLNTMEEIEQTENEMTELENLLTGEEEILAEETKTVAKKIKKIQNRRKTVAKKRDKLADELKAPLLKRYNMLLVKRAGLAVVKTVDGVCQGCFMAMPPQQYNEVRKGDKLQICPTCQRMLYYQTEECEEA